MKKIIFAIAVLACCCNFSFAQNVNNNAQTAQVGRDKASDEARTLALKETERLDQQLLLTEKQKAALTGINMKYILTSQQQQATAEGRMQIQKMKEDAIKRELSAEQFEKYKALTK